MQEKMEIEILDLTFSDSDEENIVKNEPVTPVKENAKQPNSEARESSSPQKSPNGRFIRNIAVSIDKAIAEIKKGQSLVTVASQYGIPQEILYNKLVSRSLPKETDILTKAEEDGLVKWIVKSNKKNTLIFKQQVMERVGKLKKVLKITPIFAKSKFGRMWYEYFLKNHPEIYENDGLLMPSDRVLVHSTQTVLRNGEYNTPEGHDILTPDEEDALVSWIMTANKENSLIFKFQLMRRVGKQNKIAKTMPGFAKSKFGRMWYQGFLKRHPEIYENDELLLPSENVTHPTPKLLSFGIKDSVVVLHDFRKDENSPYKLNEKNVYVQQLIKNEIEELKSELGDLKSESPLEDFEAMKSESSSECQNEFGIECDQYALTDFQNILFESNVNLKGRKKKSVAKAFCDECSLSFKSLRNLKRHMSNIHEPQEIVTCVQCGKKYSSKFRLTVHMQNVHSDSSYYKCEECGRHFKFRTSLRKHQRTVHEGLEQQTDIYFCDICEKGFKYKNSLEAHIIYGHFKESKKFSCDVCKKTFVKHSLMLRHRTRHSKIKPMACVHCGKTYSRKYLLREHVENCAKQGTSIDEESEESEISVD